ncbi:MAG: hypothetical protein FWH41_02905 [Treponema sp.]|nr:hypothetical protein [Treponema sp.]
MAGHGIPQDVEISNAAILNALKLTKGNYILKAGVLLFHQAPDQWCYGSYVKIGYFDNDVDLRYQDEINGLLISGLVRQPGWLSHKSGTF